MKVNRLEYEQLIKADIGQVWAFFSDHRNLQKLTPEKMDFQIVYPRNFDAQVYPGMLIEYRIKPPGLWRMRWLTEISQVEQGKLFVDEMRSGPYQYWHHQHIFSEKPEGVRMTDILHYSLPLGILGRGILDRYIQNKIEQIFVYRRKAIDQIFNSTAITRR